MRTLLLASTVGLVMSGSAAMAHHSFSAEYDGNKPVTLNGTVTKVTWMRFHPAIENQTAAPTGQTGSRTATPSPTRSASDVITVIGCVQRESEYRSQIADGKGGVAGSGVGAGNEVVLRSLRTVSNETLKPTATAGIAADEVYSVTGNLESEMARAVGRQVAVSGYVETAPSQGTEKVKDLPRLNAAGWHIVSERCDSSPSRRR